MTLSILIFKNNQTIQVVKSAVAFDCSGVQSDVYLLASKKLLTVYILMLLK